MKRGATSRAAVADAKKVAAAAAPPQKPHPGGSAASSKSRAVAPPPSSDDEDDGIPDSEEYEELDDSAFDEEDFDSAMFEEEEEDDDDEFGGPGPEDNDDDDDFDGSDDEEEDEDDDDIEDDEGDLEAKAAKQMKRLRELNAKAAEDAALGRNNEVKPTPLQDAERAEGEDEDDLDGTTLKPQLSLEELEDRIKETLRVLSNFKNYREEGRDRNEYLALLREDFKAMFEYNDYLLDIIIEMFPPQEAYEFMEAMEKPRPTTIRTNTIKCKRRDLVQILTKRGVNVEPLEKWSRVGLQIFESNVPVAGTVEYLAGHYMLQSAVSFLPVMALAPQENERVLDMAAAPGGKTTYIAQLMKNTGVLFANDISEPRIKSLNANIHRLGVTNAIVTQYDGVDYDKIMKNFDRVLLDAPCTGTGIISRDKSIKTSKTLQDVQRSAQQQRRLLLSAIDATKPGGYVVYSTCSFLVEENEAVVDYALRRRHVEAVDMGLPFGRPGFTKFRFLRLNPQVANSRRFFPHVHNMDGFYVCKLRKTKNGPLEANDDEEETGEKKTKAQPQAEKQLPPQQPTKGTQQPRGKRSHDGAKGEVEKKSLKLSVPPAFKKARTEKSAGQRQSTQKKGVAGPKKS